MMFLLYLMMLLIQLLPKVFFFWESFHCFVVILSPQFWTIWLEY